MATMHEIHLYMNRLTDAYQILCKFPKPFSYIFALPGFSEIEENTYNSLEKAWRNRDLSSFLKYLYKKVSRIRLESKQEQYIKALAICLWMDSKIIYTKVSDDDTPKYLSVFELIPFQGIRPLEVGAMNTNYKRTGVQAIPKFGIYKLYEVDYNHEKSAPNPFSNRDAFRGINGMLNNVSLVSWNEQLHIHNIIIPPSFPGKETGNFTVAFCPLSDQSDELYSEEKDYVLDAIKYCGVSVCGLKRPEILHHRLRSDWLIACAKAKADIVFFPEALGSLTLEESDYINGKARNKLIHQLSRSVLTQGFRPPLLTILPSICQGGVNSATIVYRDGYILGQQNKHVPFVDRTNHRIEALTPCREHHFYMLHIPGVHRIVVMICAEFLDICNNHNQISLFEELGATLILVPSYSHGERDFLNALPSLKCYGATVIWGNCCGATGASKVVGGCSVAGTDTVYRFSAIRNCDGTCDKRTSCTFAVPLPLCIDNSKSDQSEIEPIQHYTFIPRIDGIERP